MELNFPNGVLVKTVHHVISRLCLIYRDETNGTMSVTQRLEAFLNTLVVVHLGHGKRFHIIVGFSSGEPLKVDHFLSRLYLGIQCIFIRGHLLLNWEESLSWRVTIKMPCMRGCVMRNCLGVVVQGLESLIMWNYLLVKNDVLWPRNDDVSEVKHTSLDSLQRASGCGH
jgi:hypothetical protein